jgi:hypothetical protein
MKAGFKLAAAVTFLAYSDYSAVAETRPVSMDAIAEEVSGPGTAEQRRRVAELLIFIVDMALQPQRLTVENLAALEGNNFEKPSCLTRPDGIRRCAYAYTSGEFVVRLNYLETFSLKNQSDSGARVKLEFRPEVVCLHPRTLSKLWDVAPANGTMVVQDFFGGSDDAAETNPVTAELYKDIVPSKPYIFVQTKSARGCVTSLDLSAVPPSTF